MARAFEKNLKEYKTKKKFSDAFVKLHEHEFLEVDYLSAAGLFSRSSDGVLQRGERLSSDYRAGTRIKMQTACSTS